MDDKAAARHRYKWLAAWGLVALAVLIADSELSPYALVTPVPWIVKGPAIATAMVFGAWLASGILDHHKLIEHRTGLRGTIGLMALPFLLAPVGSYVGRRGYEIAAFAGDVERQAGTVEGAISSSWRKRSRITLEIDPSLRTLDIPVDYRAAPSAIGRFCIPLALERGRFGATRTRLPSILDEPIHLDVFQPCSPGVLERNFELARRVARIEGHLIE